MKKTILGLGAVFLACLSAQPCRGKEPRFGDAEALRELNAGHHQRAAELYCAAAARADRENSLDRAIANYEYCATIYMDIDELLPAMLNIQTALTRAEARKRPRRIELARLYRKQGNILQVAHKDHAVAIGLFRRALEYYRAEGARLEQAAVLHSIGVSQTHIGERDKAIVSFRKALALIRDSKPTNVRVLIRADLASLLAAQGQRLAAAKLFDAMLADMKIITNQPSTLKRAFKAYAQFQRQEGNEKEAAEYEAAASNAAQARQLGLNQMNSVDELDLEE